MPNKFSVCVRGSMYKQVSLSIITWLVCGPKRYRYITAFGGRYLFLVHIEIKFFHRATKVMT